MLKAKNWRPDALVVLVFTLVISMLVGMLVASLLPRQGDHTVVVLAIGALSFHGVALPAVWWFLRAHRLTWSEAFGFGAPGSGRATLLALGATVLALPVAWGLGFLSSEIMTLVHVTPVSQKAVTVVQQTVAVGPQIFMAALAVALAPVAEELLFRGVLYPALRAPGVLPWFCLRKPPLPPAPPAPAAPTLNGAGDPGDEDVAAGASWLRCPRPWAAALATSLVFGVIHLNVMTFLSLTFFGLVLTWLYETTGNLLAPMVSHSLFNLANFFFLVWGRPPA
jgi:membrane protease YdiL (CAAX protease family)